MSQLSHNMSCIILLFFFLFHFATYPSACANNETADFGALIAFKRAILNDPLGALNSWNETTHFCDWNGILCSKRHRNRVVEINLMSQSLIGSISPHLGNLSFLTYISLQNNSLHGQIPEEIGRLRRLLYVEFSNNSFTGEIPRNLSQCTNIYYLNLIDNNLSGNIIPELGSLQKLKALGLAINGLSGTIPPSIGNLTNLQQLSLRNCGLDGEIPNSLVQLQSLRRMLFEENNLSGTIPVGLFNISTITIFSVITNRLQGTIPLNIGLTLPRLQNLGLGDNQFTGTIPISLSNSSLLQTFEVSQNSFNGQIRINFGSLFALEHLNINDNQLSGDLTFLTSLVNCTRLQTLNLADNLFNSSLPSSISNLSSTHLTFLDLGYNQLHGSIPVGIENLVNLTVFGLYHNNLDGPISSVFGKLNKLQLLILNSNSFTNEIPFSFGNLTSLNKLYLEQNNFYGNIPQSLINCTSLQLLSISSNNLSGLIPQEIMSLSSISIVIDLSYNAFSGSIPSEVGSLTNLGILDLSYNRLSGPIPVSLSSCTSLEQIFLQSNSLYGKIPDELSTLRGIQSMDLSENNLSGPIPQFLGELDLLYLNLSFNKLEGEVPTSKVFRNESGIFLKGNSDLCGGIPFLNFHSCPSTSLKKEHFSLDLKILIPLVSAGAIFITLSACLYIFVYQKRAPQRADSSISSFEMGFLRLSYADLLKSTGGFSEDKLLGVGRFGSVYKGIFSDGQIQVAVKVLNLSTRGALKSFVSECNALRGVRHRNLVKIVSVCSSVDFQGNDFKALVYDFKANGDLGKLLHPNTQEETRNLSTRQRLKIVTNIAAALEYLHCGIESIIVHGDLKPSNVLLDEEINAYVGDFGLAKIVSDITSTYGSSSIGIKGTIGYIPPEYGMNAMISTEGDVYSFGILLLEIFTGKKPTCEIFQGSLSIRNFVGRAFPSQVEEVVDPIILLEYNHRLDGKIKNSIVSVLEIGLECSNESPKDRITMSDVVKQLSKLSV